MWRQVIDMKLNEVIAGVLNIESSVINDESNALNTPNWTSLRHIELILAVENAFGVRFSMSEIVTMQNVGDMRSLLVEKGASEDETEVAKASA